MSRYSHTQPAPDRTRPPEPAFDGDTEFTSVNMKDDRASLPPGVLALSVNKRLRHKKAATRAGIWLPVFANILALDLIRGWGVYSNPNGEELLLVAGDRLVYAHRDGTYPLTIPVKAPPAVETGGETPEALTPSSLADSIEFVQAHDKIYLYQGTEKKQLVWDGVSSAGFVEITKSHPADTSTKLIPPAVTAEHVSDRTLIIKGKNDIIITDVLDYTSYDHILQVHHVGREAGEQIIRVLDYAKGIVIVFTPRSVYLLLNFTGNPAAATVEPLTSQWGLAGRKACIKQGGEVFYLSAQGRGIYRVSQSFEDRQQVVARPVTDCIQPLMHRINWPAAGGAVAQSTGEYTLFAVPIDGSLVNNCLIIYNGATGKIEGYDTFPAPFQIDDLLVTFYRGEQRMFALDKNAARIYVLDEGKSDFVFDPATSTVTEHPIADLMETRGYATLGGNGTATRDFQRVEMAVSTWAPSILVTELTERAADERPLNLTPITKSRTEYDNFGKKNWVPTNVNDDWGAPGRQDYSMALGPPGVYLKGGIDLERKQRGRPLRFSTRCRGQYISYRIANSQGQCDVISVAPVESAGSHREPRRAG